MVIFLLLLQTAGLARPLNNSFAVNRRLTGRVPGSSPPRPPPMLRGGVYRILTNYK